MKRKRLVAVEINNSLKMRSDSDVVPYSAKFSRGLIFADFAG